MIVDRSGIGALGDDFLYRQYAVEDGVALGRVSEDRLRLATDMKPDGYPCTLAVMARAELARRATLEA